MNLHCIVCIHDTFWFVPFGTKPKHIWYINTFMDSDFAFLIPQMIHLLDRNKDISHFVNKSEIYNALSQIAKFIISKVLQV